MKLLLLLALLLTLGACQNPSRVVAAPHDSVRDQSEDGSGSLPQLLPAPGRVRAEVIE